MTCPKCQGSMAAVEVQGIEVDRCSDCGGLWFDLLEHEDLKQLGGSANVDVGDAAKARLHDSKAQVRCPRDTTLMIPMVDLSQPHIWFESCPVCHGAYFDAGEFKDFTNFTLFEKLVRRSRPRPL